MALPGVELAERVADVDRFDVGGIDAGIGENRFDRFLREVAHVLVLLRNVAGEVGLMAAENCSHCSLSVVAGCRQICRSSGLTTLPTGLRGSASRYSSRSGSL